MCKGPEDAQRARNAFWNYQGQKGLGKGQLGLKRYACKYHLIL